ncbi:hypothetical protein WG68_13060 [Arsukibacterium ikkense]|uniref:Uncharacterized protein n=1 Tax=Arsukibacterium ikkense TaxID=336831 RepID=A0A0M2V7C7_9GAMM|nr:hypothetical protein [Arsukibacterium ikkense]KKO45058.1 hypothetical protein WG68_13060 [Arsukibacterium ikkense]
MSKPFLSFVIFLFICSPVMAAEIDYAFDYSKSVLKIYEQKIINCRAKQKQNTSLTEEEKLRLKDIAYNPDVLPYLAERAFNGCVLPEKADYMESLLILGQLNQSANNIKVTNYLKQQQAVSFTYDNLAIIRSYQALPAELRQTFESIESLKRPFNGIMILETIWPPEL